MSTENFPTAPPYDDEVQADDVAADTASSSAEHGHPTTVAEQQAREHGHRLHPADVAEQLESQHGYSHEDAQAAAVHIAAAANGDIRPGD